MKVVHIGDNVLFGHRFNGHDLGKYLRKRGIASNHLVWWKNKEDSHTFEIAGHLQYRTILRDFFAQLNILYSSNAIFYPFSYDLLFDQRILESDVVHLHLIHNSFFDISHLPIISRLKPVVWTLHDPWAIQGHCIYPVKCDRWLIGCGECPDLLRSIQIRHDASALNWEYKKLIFQACDLDIIVASQWTYDKARKSPFFTNAKLHLINFGLDLNQFKPVYDNAVCKKKFNIPAQNIVIAFRGASWIYKGLDYIKECLRNLSNSMPITLLVFNEKGLLREFSERFQVVELGWVDDDREMIDAYNAADIFLMPSAAEAFGMMAMEAMACGKPVIVMDQTALPEVIRPEETGGIVVPQGDVDAMRTQLEKLLIDSSLRNSIGKRSRAVTEKYYSIDRYVSKIVAVYEEAIERKKGDARAQYIIDQQKKIELSKSDFSLSIPQVNIMNVPSNAVPENKVKIDNVHSISISDMEFKVISLLRKIKQVHFVYFCYLRIAKPAYRSMRRIFGTIK
jgi:glycosyltransferase involved in cell wall biosynthesis